MRGSGQIAVVFFAQAIARGDRVREVREVHRLLPFEGRARAVDPFGLLTRDGFWYVAGFDHGNVQFVGTGYADRLLWRAATRTLVQVERIVPNEEIRRSPEAS